MTNLFEFMTNHQIVYEGIIIRLGTVIDFVFNHIVPQLSPKPNYEQSKKVSFVRNLSAILVTIREGIEAPPKLPNSSKL